MGYSLSLLPLEAWPSPDDIVSAVRRAEELGFFGVGLAEHLFTPVSGSERVAALPSRFWVDNFAFGAALAQATRRIRFLLSALIVPYRHPMLAAKSIATLDWILGGRLDVTTGVGWLREEFDVLGVPFSERGARTDEYLQATIALWTQEYPAFHGRFVEFADLVTGPPCVQKPHVPLLIGGDNENAYRRVLDYGAGWAPMLATPEAVRSGLRRLGELAEQRGRALAPDLRIFPRIYVLGGNTALRQAGSHVPGTAESVVAHGRNARAETLELIAGYVSAGVNEIGLSFPWRTPDEYIERLEWFAAEIMPNT